MKNVDIIIPCFNEKGFIVQMLDSVLAQDYPKHLLHIYVADGMSTDGTRDILASYKSKHSNIYIVDNPRRTTPYALNLALEASSSEIIVRMDCHAYYPTNYVSYLVSNLESQNADNVGLCVETLPANDSAKCRGIALAMSVPIGVGNSAFRTGVSEIKLVETVPFGCYRRNVFSRIGLFDLDLTRSQDCELNSRLIKSGGKIYLLPGPKIGYYARDSYKKLAKMFYQYGLYKPLTNIKSKRVMSWRQIVPSLFLISLVTTGILGLFSKFFGGLFLFIILFYEAVLFLFVLRRILGTEKFSLGLAMSTIWSIHILHFTYGAGFLRGLWNLLFRRTPVAVTISR